MPRRTNHRLTKTLIDNAPNDSVVWDSEVPGFGLRVTPAGTRSFIFQFRAGRSEQGRVTIGRYPAMSVEHPRLHYRTKQRLDQGCGQGAY